MRCVHLYSSISTSFYGENWILKPFTGVGWVLSSCGPSPVCSHPGLWMSFKTNKHKFVSGERCLAFMLANKRDMLAIRHTNQLHSHYHHHHHDITGIGTIRNKNNINLKSAIPVPKPFANNFDKKTIKPPLRTCSFFQGWMLRKTVIVTGKGKGMNWWGNKHETFKKGHVFLIERV